MATTIKASRTGRTIITLDGCSDYHGGALVQGAQISKVSYPASIKLTEDDYGNKYLSINGVNEDLQQAAYMARRGEIKGARVYELRHVS